MSACLSMEHPDRQRGELQYQLESSPVGCNAAGHAGHASRSVPLHRVAGRPRVDRPPTRDTTIDRHPSRLDSVVPREP